MWGKGEGAQLPPLEKSKGVSLSIQKGKKKKMDISREDGTILH